MSWKGVLEDEGVTFWGEEDLDHTPDGDERNYSMESYQIVDGLGGFIHQVVL